MSSDPRSNTPELVPVLGEVLASLVARVRAMGLPRHAHGAELLSDGVHDFYLVVAPVRGRPETPSPEPKAVERETRGLVEDLLPTDRAILKALGRDVLTADQIAGKLRIENNSQLRARLGPRGDLRRRGLLVQRPGAGYELTELGRAALGGMGQ